jgi:tRNA-dihydrouridine synthase 1
MSSPSVAESAADAHSQRAWKRWREIGSPRWVCAPMVDGSELAFRELVRRYSTDLCYTPMINAKIFVNDAEYRRSNFTTNAADRPLVAQFCADDPAVFVAGAKLLQDRVDAVDLNLGCPQGIARRGHYGSYLQDEWELIASIVRAASAQLDVPVWVKIRIFPCPDKSVRYAQMLEAAGASVIAVHGRTREQKGKFCMPADLDVIRAIKRAVTVSVIANGCGRRHVGVRAAGQPGELLRPAGRRARPVAAAAVARVPRAGGKAQDAHAHGQAAYV